MSTALVWFRRDLRLTDNPALHAACERHQHVLPVFVWAPDEEALWAPGGAARWWLHHSLAALEVSLNKLGAPLQFVAGNSLQTLTRLAETTGAAAVYWNRLYEPAVIARDKRIKSALRDRGLEAESFNAALLAEPWTQATGSGTPYKVFTPFWRKLEARLDGIATPLPAPDKLHASDNVPKSDLLDDFNLLPALQWDAGLSETWTPGEAGALKRLQHFLDGPVVAYREGRDRPATEATSRLSPHLHWGELSPRQILATVARHNADGSSAAERASTAWYLREIGWREFAHHLLYHYPQTPDQPLYDKFDPFPWRQPDDYAADLRAWQRGQTGIPIVDAGMRELWHTGWMHNRVRMIVASFLTKNLLIPWQEGARWFWDTLVDASLANNTLGWQWSAGCGADAAPYFRIFNPVTQSQKFDAEGIYLKRWIPALRKLDDKPLHAPWETVDTSSAYPAPIVDLRDSRARALAAYTEIKTSGKTPARVPHSK